MTFMDFGEVSYKNSLAHVPALVRNVSPLVRGCRVLNYGCGQHWEVSHFHLKEFASVVHHYDPYSTNKKLRLLKPASYHAVIVSNILNVLPTNDLIEHVLNEIEGRVMMDGRAYFSIYEGDGSGVPVFTETATQRNLPTSFYKELLRSLGWAVFKFPNARPNEFAATPPHRSIEFQQPA